MILKYQQYACFTLSCGSLFISTHQSLSLCPELRHCLLLCLLCSGYGLILFISSMFIQCILSPLLLEDGSGCLCLLSSHHGCNSILVFRVEADNTFIQPFKGTLHYLRIPQRSLEGQRSHVGNSWLFLVYSICSLCLLDSLLIFLLFCFRSQFMSFGLVMRSVFTLHSRFLNPFSSYWKQGETVEASDIQNKR